ncbi:hypothetical protein [Synechocystis sp. LKSZ1]|uniref:hypothetical protein n=1 Tax=Synechocystis sp. LKSZ1 TaxID=3144951 RepID=UPI00336BD98A
MNSFPGGLGYIPRLVRIPKFVVNLSACLLLAGYYSGLGWLGGSMAPAFAQVNLCRIEGPHTLCLETVKRSAKYPWEYRVVVTMDGIPQAPQRYNCRDRVKVNTDGYLEPLKSGGLAQRLCQKLSSFSNPGTSHARG